MKLRWTIYIIYIPLWLTDSIWRRVLFAINGSSGGLLPDDTKPLKSVIDWYPKRDTIGIFHCFFVQENTLEMSSMKCFSWSHYVNKVYQSRRNRCKNWGWDSRTFIAKHNFQTGLLLFLRLSISKSEISSQNSRELTRIATLNFLEEKSSRNKLFVAQNGLRNCRSVRIMKILYPEYSSRTSDSYMYMRQ